MPALRRANRFRSAITLATALPLATLGLLLAAPAQAHVFGAWGAGFPQGFLHPLTGLDHELAMLGVGFWAGQMGGRARWLVPLAFVIAMLAGGAVGLAGFSLPGMEIGIGGSILLLGLLIALRSHLPLPASMGLVAVFAVCHGIAHGAEAPEAAQPLLYCLGFVLATTLLHGIGLGVAGLLAPLHRRGLLPFWSERLVGMITALLGLGLLVELGSA